MFILESPVINAERKKIFEKLSQLFRKMFCKIKAIKVAKTFSGCLAFMGTWITFADEKS